MGLYRESLSLQQTWISSLFLIGDIMNDANGIEYQTRLSMRMTVTPETERIALKPKGACWYCNAPLDNIRRFCNKTCAQDYQTEEEAFKPVTS